MPNIADDFPAIRARLTPTVGAGSGVDPLVALVAERFRLVAECAASDLAKP